MKGFTLIETVLVLLILALMMSLVAPRVLSFQRSGSLRNAAEEVVDILRLSQSRSYSSFRSSVWSVSFEPDQFILFKGTDFEERTEDYDHIYKLPGSVEFGETTLPNGIVSFEKLDGKTDSTGFIELKEADGGNVKSVCVTEYIIKLCDNVD